LSEPIANVVGVGNILMRDDGAGPAAAAIVEAGAPAGVCVYDAGLAVGDVIGTLDPEVPLVVIDALRGGGKPGSVYTGVMDEGSPFEEPGAAMMSLHEVSVLPALRMEALSGRPFRDVTVFGIEPEAVEWGEGLTGCVAAGLERLVEAVFKHLEALGESRAGVAEGTGERDL